MSKRNHKRGGRQKPSAPRDIGKVLDEVQRPKAGPGQHFVREFIDAQSGHAKRFRNVGVSTLMLAYHKGQLESRMRSKIDADDRFAAGQKFAVWHYVLHAGGRDSTEPVLGTGGSGFTFTEAKESAGREIARVKTRMEANNFTIIERFCGLGHTMPDSLRGVVEFHEDATASRIREALDDLVRATGGPVTAMAQRVGGRIRAETIHPFQEDDPEPSS